MAFILNKRLQTGFEVSAPILTFSNTSVGAQQPQDLIIDYNGSATLTAIAKAVNPSTGSLSSGTISYQWYKDGFLLPGETGENLYLNSQLLAANYYSVATFTPNSGIAPAINGPSLSSRTASTSIRIYISITSQPSYKRITEGQSALFSIAAVASNGDNASLRYEWYVNGSIASTTIGGTYSSVTVSPGVGSYQVYCKISQGGVPNATAAPSINSSIVTLDVDAKPAAQCLGWDDPIRPGGKDQTIKTVSGLKPGPVSTWYGPWVFGTDNDTCYIYMDLEIRDIYPRAINSNTDKPFIAVFECRIRGNGGSGSDKYHAFKVLEWNGNSRFENQSNKQTLNFSTGDFNGETVIAYGDNGQILYQRTEENAVAQSTGLCCGRLKWDPSWGKPAIDILFTTAKRKENGATIDSFLTVNSTKDNNLLEYGRRFDPNVDVPENRTVVANAVNREVTVQLTNQKNANQNYDRSQVVNTNIKSWSNTTAGEGYGEGSPPIGNSAVSLGVGQWELVSPDRDCEVAIEMAGAAGEGATGWNNAFTPGGQGGVGVIYLKLLKGVVYTFHVGRTGSSKNTSKYPNQSSPGGGWSSSEMPDYNGNGGGATYLYKGGRLIAVAAGGGGSGRGAKVVGATNTNPPPNPGAAGGGPGVDGASATTNFGGSGGTQSAPGNNRTPSEYNRDTRSNGRDFWMRDGECATWIPGANDGACGCTYTNSSKQTYSDSTSPKRILDDDSSSNTVQQSCDTYGRSEIA
jgi:hypothetical protein